MVKEKLEFQVIIGITGDLKGREREQGSKTFYRNLILVGLEAGPEGFEPPTCWSEASRSLRTELRALNPSLKSNAQLFNRELKAVICPLYFGKRKFFLIQRNFLKRKHESCHGNMRRPGRKTHRLRG